MRLLAILVLAAALAAGESSDTDYKSYGEGARAMLGINMAPVGADAQAKNGIDPSVGVEVNSVYSGSAAEHMGLQGGDVIVSVNGGDIGSMTDLRNEVALAGVGGDVTLTVLRNGQRVVPNGTLGEWPKDIPFTPIDDASERRFRDWQGRRLDRTQAAVNNLRKQLEDLERAKAASAKPPAKPLSPAQAMEAPVSQALAGLPPWKLTLRDGHDTGAPTATSERTTPIAWDARVLIGSPAPESL